MMPPYILTVATAMFERWCLGSKGFTIAIADHDNY